MMKTRLTSKINLISVSERPVTFPPFFRIFLKSCWEKQERENVNKGSGSWILYTPCISLLHSRGMYTMQKRCSYSWLGKLANNPTILVRTSRAIYVNCCIKSRDFLEIFNYYFDINHKNHNIKFLFKIKSNDWNQKH